MSVSYKKMSGDDPVRFGFDVDAKLVVIEVSREAIEDYLSIPADGNYEKTLSQNEIKISSSLAAWLATDKPTTSDVDGRLLASIMEKYNAH